MTIPTLTTLPVAPARTDPPATFVTRADAFLAAIVTFQGEMNTSIGAMNTDIAGVNVSVIAAQDAQAAAETAETNAEAAQAAAEAASNATLWVSGTSYSSGDVVYSPINYLSYRANTATSGTTDPSLSADWDALNFELPSQTGNTGKYLTTDGTDPSWGVIDALPDQTGNAGKYLTTDGTDESWAEVSTSPVLEAVASGTLANGDKVIINTDGTVSVAGLSESYSPNIGTLTQFESGNTSYTAPAFDSNSNKIVIAYQDTSNSEYGTAVVGTVSGTTISFGTPVVFASVGAFFPSSTFDSNSNKIVISYSDENIPRKGRSIVGTVSGTSISFGSPTIFSENQVSFCQSTFDSSSNKVVVFFRDQANDTLSAAVGTVSGTSISFGSVVIVDNVGYGAGFFATTFDSNLNKVVVCFRGQFDLNGYAEVGTVSGTSISFGSTATFLASRVDGVGITFDSNSNKVVISYKDYNNSQYGTAIVGTVSGTSISFGSSVVFRSIDISNNQTVPVFDSNSNKIALTYQAGSVQTVVGTVSGTSISFANDIYNPSGGNAFINAAFDSNANKVVITSVITQGRAVVYSMTAQVTNLTTENYIGISDGAYSDTATATVQIIGSVDDAQSGLTAGQSYYIQNDGSLGTTPDDPSVFAGTAVSATKLIVKG